MKLLLLSILLCTTFFTVAQTQPSAVPRPKLVVGIMVDQMRWDFLYRYANRYSAGGFKRMMREGFNCENTYIPYTPTVTAAGHTCVYTGSVPAIHGVAGNAWFDRGLGRIMYCSEDTSSKIKSVGGDAKNGRMSPANMLTTTITDELRLATNLRSKVVGVCIKDRGAIFPAGHRANAAFWYDGKTGNWITSTHYMDALPAWLEQYNQQKWPDQYYAKNWLQPLYDIKTYTQSTKDENAYEGKFKNAKTTSFPHDLSGYIGKDYDVIPGTPYGNTMTLEVAKAALANYRLGEGTDTDFLAVSLSSPDYIGHRFGPNSIEVEDTYLRLDLDLAAFLQHLDARIGKGKYTVFLTADHGVAHIPGFMIENKIPAGNWDNDTMVKNLNQQLAAKFGIEKLISGEANYQLYLNRSAIAQANADEEKIKDYIIDFCKKMPGIGHVFDLKRLGAQSIPQPIYNMLVNGYHQKRSGDIQVLLEPGWIDGGTTGTTHGLWNPYDAHIPMLWMGWGIKPGSSFRTMHMTDIAPTLAALLRIQTPNGTVGQVMTEVLR
jgi:predicted AlkP superfamily pyrophosphatase or phosphodiesterase